MKDNRRMPARSFAAVCMIFHAFHHLAVDAHLHDRTAFVIMSQEAHEKMADNTKEKIVQSLTDVGVNEPHVILLHKDLPPHGGWTVFPILGPLLKRYGNTIDWFLFLDEASAIDPIWLGEILRKHNPKDLVFLGKALKDKDSVIIHHYSQDFEFKYPDFSAGFVFSSALLEKLSNKLKDNNFNLKDFPKDFSIDAQYELAKVIKDVQSDIENGNKHENNPQSVTLTHDKGFCVTYSKLCATWKQETNCKATTEEVRAMAEKTLFAVKTCEKYHSERLPIVFETWGQAAVNIEYFSEVSDPVYGTKVLPEVKQNTERGHCMKTEAILRYFKNNKKVHGWEWLVIADDDTLMSAHKMLEFLKCYNPMDALAIGQRYGFRVAEGKYGYDYITGGGGMVFSSKMVDTMLKEDGAYCYCPKPDTPDDMHLAGACIANLGLAVVHTDRFHQARPEDYPPSLLKHRDPISFHKFWNNKPLEIYKKYFADADKNLKDYKFSKKTRHQEL